VEVLELTLIGRRGPELQGIWQRVDARPTPCLDLKLVCGGTRSVGYRQRPRAHLGRGSEPVGGANCSAPHRVTLTLLLDNYISMSFSSARTRKNLLLKNVLLIDTELEDVDGGPPGGAIGISGSGHHRR
jgi:hypothetical protein